jgi:hypothetical protein
MNNYGEIALLINKINDIKSDLIELDLLYDDLNLILKKTILIDNEIVCYKEMNDLKNSVNNLVNQISNDIIPSFSKKICNRKNRHKRAFLTWGMKLYQKSKKTSLNQSSCV